MEDNLNDNEVSEENIEDGEKDEHISQGVIYVLWNPMFAHYGECYKIGRSRNIKQRLTQYTTVYPEKSEVKFLSEIRQDVCALEKAIHKRLNEFRMSSQREFFKCNIEFIISTINHMILNGYEIPVQHLKHKQKRKQRGQKQQKEPKIITRKIHYNERFEKRIKMKSVKERNNFIYEINQHMKRQTNLNIDFLRNQTGELSETAIKYYHIGLDILKAIGFESLTPDIPIKINWEALKTFINQKDYTIHVLFGTDYFKMDKEITNHVKNSLALYSSHKIKILFNMQFCNLTKKKDPFYVLKYCS